jgi:hypothetical protein
LEENTIFRFGANPTTINSSRLQVKKLQWYFLWKLRRGKRLHLAAITDFTSPKTPKPLLAIGVKAIYLTPNCNLPRLPAVGTLSTETDKEFTYVYEKWN